MTRISIIDSHTGGEPTRVIVAGGPDLGNGPLAERARLFREHHDHVRSAVVNEPRGSDVLVGALLTPPVDPARAAGVIFFNNVGPLGMCGHGMIGVVKTLEFLGRIKAGEHRFETPVGEVTARLGEDGRVTIRNVPSWRKAADVAVQVDGRGTVTGDVAWGGNWFFLVKTPEFDLSSMTAAELAALTSGVRRAVNAQGFPEVDHVEVFGPPLDPANHCRNFVLCPGLEWDRSPCGTGTSAKLACLAADGKLAPGETWRQESFIGSVFEASYEALDDGKILPSITGRAWITARAELILDPSDPFRHGIR